MKGSHTKVKLFNGKVSQSIIRYIYVNLGANILIPLPDGTRANAIVDRICDKSVYCTYYRAFQHHRIKVRSEDILAIMA